MPRLGGGRTRVSKRDEIAAQCRDMTGRIMEFISLKWYKRIWRAWKKKI